MNEPPPPCVAHLDLTGPVPLVVVDVRDWLDAATAPGLQAALEQALAARPARLAVDLTLCEMADPYGLRTLVRVRARAHAQGTSFALVGANARIRRLLRLLGLTQVLPVVSPDAVTAG